MTDDVSVFPSQLLTVEVLRRPFESTLDSTGVLELVAHIEEHYGIQVETDELIPDNLDSIESIAAFLLRKKRLTSEQQRGG